MTQDDTAESFDLGELILENSKKMDEFLENNYEKIKNNTKSSELIAFWNKFDKKLKDVQKNKSDNEVLIIHVKINDARYMLVNEMDIIEPWFVKVEGVNCKTGIIEKEILNSRKEEPEILIELYKN